MYIKMSNQVWKNICRRLKNISYYLYDLFGLGFIAQKIHPPLNSENKRAPITIVIWFVSIYSAAYTIAFSLYTTSYNTYTAKLSLISSKLDSKEYRASAISRLAEVQNHKFTPEPKLIFTNSNIFVGITSPFISIFQKETDPKLVKEVAELIVTHSQDLSNTELSNIQLNGQNLRGAVIKNTLINNSQLENTKFISANLEGSIIKNSNLIGVDFSGASLKGVSFIENKLDKANFLYADLSGAKFIRNRFDSETSFDRSLFTKTDFVLQKTPDDFEYQSGICTASTVLALTNSINRDCYEAIFYFGYDLAHFSSEYDFEIYRIVKILEKYPGIKVLIEGHTESFGTPEYNIGLGEKRAKYVEK